MGNNLTMNGITEELAKKIVSGEGVLHWYKSYNLQPPTEEDHDEDCIGCLLQLFAKEWLAQRRFMLMRTLDGERTELEVFDAVGTNK